MLRTPSALAYRSAFQSKPFLFYLHVYLLLARMIQLEPSFPNFPPLTPFLTAACRKNLSELDEVQRYFSEKLTRSFPDFSTSRPGREEWESDPRGSLGRQGDPKGCHLLEKSSQLVSQVSSLINGELLL